MNRTIHVVVGTMLLSLAGSAFAHHSTAMFDHTKEVTVEGTVKSWQWTNPHSWLQIMAPDKSGKLVEQGYEVGAPNTMFRNGWRVSSFKPGDKVTIVANPRLNGEVGGMLVAAKIPSGTWLTWLPKAGRTAGQIGAGGQPSGAPGAPPK